MSKSTPKEWFIGNYCCDAWDRVYGMPSCPTCGEVTYSQPECPFCGQALIDPDGPIVQEWDKTDESFYRDEVIRQAHKAKMEVGA